MIFDPTPCMLGEGPLWHDGRAELIWFDIVNRRMFARGLDAAQAQRWDFDSMVSAAGIVDDTRLIVASETALSVFDLTSGASVRLCDLEPDRPDIRSNDGRADRQGGFWIGTMGKQAQPGAGSIWRWYRGELRRLFSGLTITNAICFSPDGRFAQFTDTVARVIWRVELDAEGWPQGQPAALIDLSATDLNPDGAVTDAGGHIWVAQWGAGRVARYDGAGAYVGQVAVPVAQPSCPAFGGADLTTLFVTTARQDLADPRAADGAVFALPNTGTGLPEGRVLLP